MKLARKMTIALVLGIFAVIAVHSYSRVRREAGMFENDMRRDGHIMGRVLGGAAFAVWRSDGEPHAKRLVEEVNEREGQVTIRWVALDAPEGDPSAPRLRRELLGPVARGQEVVGKASDPDGTESLVTYAPVRLGDGAARAIEISESLGGERDYIHATISNTLVTTAALALVCGAMTIGLGVWFVGRPMHNLIEQARRVGAGDLSRRLHLTQRDEIGELAAEMNGMCDRLIEANDRAAAEMSRRIEALEQLRHADRLATVGRLASGMAHELGAPLQVVSGRAKMIADGDVSGPEVAHNARIIHDQVVRMASIIRQLLDFARRRAADKAPADLAEIARKTCLLLAPLADKRRVVLTTSAPPESPPAAPGEAAPAARPFLAKVDAEQIQQALTNLVVNGIQAMPRGGTLSLQIRRERLQPATEHDAAACEHLRLDVEDRGEGMSPETMEHVFEPFFTTKPPGEGTGLGLAVAQGIVREHGGWIGVQSTLGSGSLFSMYLPADGEA